LATWSGDVNTVDKTPSNAQLDVLTVGEAMALFVAQTPGNLADVAQFNRTSAGAELNVAIGLSRLGWKVGYVSRVGSDLLGDFLLATLAQEGIDRRHLRVDTAHATGLMFKSLETSGQDPTTQYFRKNSAASCMALGDLTSDAFVGVRRLHITGISVALSDSVRELVQYMVVCAGAAGAQISFDPNIRPQLWPSQQKMVSILNAFATQSDLVMPGLTEGQLLSGQTSPYDIASYYLDQGVKQVVIKLGPTGAYFANQIERGMVSGFCVPRVLDTVGAGDGFAVGVISALMDGLSLEDATLRGNAIGSRVVQYPGDSDGLPNQTELADTLAGARLPSTKHPTESTFKRNAL
jgi:2-dehydro-3-deoxygluconokinase